MKVFKNGCNGGGDGKSLLEMGRTGMGGVVSIMGGWEIYSWERGANPVILWKPSILSTTLLVQILSTPLPTSLSPPTPTPNALSVVIFLRRNRWSWYIWCTFLLNYNMDLHMSRLGTLVPEGPWYWVYATRHQFYWGLTHTFFYWYSDLISHTKTHSTLRDQ